MEDSALQGCLADLRADEMELPRLPVARAARICPLGQIIAARHRGRDVAVAKLADGRVFVMPDRCPHDGGRLSDGFVDGEIIVCSRHGWEFELESGQCVGRPSLEIASKVVKSRDS